MKIGRLIIILLVLGVIYFIFFRNKCKEYNTPAKCEECRFFIYENMVIGDYVKAKELWHQCDDCKCNPRAEDLEVINGNLA